MTALSYSRKVKKASSEQTVVEPKSIPSQDQLSACRAYAKTHNMVIVREYIDRGSSGFNTPPE